MAQNDDLAKHVAKNIEKMFGKHNVPIFSQDETTGETVLSDINDNEVGRFPALTNPLNRKPFKILHTYVAICLKTDSSDDEYPQVDEPVTVDFMPNGNFYMHNHEGLVCNTDAKLGVDFELLDIPGNDEGKGPGEYWMQDKTYTKLFYEYWENH